MGYTIFQLVNNTYYNYNITIVMVNPMTNGAFQLVMGVPQKRWMAFCEGKSDSNG